MKERKIEKFIIRNLVELGNCYVKKLVNLDLLSRMIGYKVSYHRLTDGFVIERGEKLN